METVYRKSLSDNTRYGNARQPPANIDNQEAEQNLQISLLDMI
jgi:hypothetical protein